MSGEARAVSSPAEEDRLEAQRQAFSRLMARFTADRDAMIAQVQQCNERLDALTAQIVVGGPVSSAEGSTGGGAEVKALIERALSQQQTGIAEARTGGEQARRRAEECASRVRELAEQVAERESTVDGVRQALEGVSERIARLEEAFLAQAPEEAAGPLAEDMVHEIAERLAEVEDHLRAVEASVDAARARSERVPLEEPAGNQMLAVGLRDLRAQVSELESLAAWTPKLQRLWVSLVASAVFAALAVAYVG